MKNNIVNKQDAFQSVYEEIKNLIDYSQKKVYTTINREMLYLYWNIGKIILQIQEGEARANYGENLLDNLSIKLTSEFGKGFSKRNLERMRKFYVSFPNATTLSSQLSWSHYLELLKIDDLAKRNFYLKETIASNWSIRELQRQKSSLLYERLSISKTKEEVSLLSCEGHEIRTGKDLIKDPFVLEFLDLKDNMNYLEYDLEKNILNHLKEFLLELGKGFMFVGSQVRMTLEEDHFYPDLVFYNRLAKCFVIIDLKIGRLSHGDLGQMQMYVNYYDREIKSIDENSTIGILLCTDKNKTVVKYTLPENNETIFASEYKLHLPTEEELIEKVEEEIKNYQLFEED